MTTWFFETLLWTAALIALVLLIRRPVARHFGPQTAYALWALPMLRLVLPPIQLPSWLAPAQTASETQTTSTILFLDPATPFATQEAVAGSKEAVANDAMPFTPQYLLEATPWLELGIVAWLIGAAIFLYLRFAAYFQLRRELLTNAREVGRVNKVRLIETPGTTSPIAFGVFDPVIALPPGFMAQPDRTARDLALAHELAHHTGRDLLINMAVQPLFALHWFNPLGRYGWLALRRDQEAACDARVISAKPAHERALYANVIAGFAAGPKAALAAPMACPVLGEKSIIQRLRSLTMTDHSPRRRVAGRLLMGAGVLALPLTASISYAEAKLADAPAAPTAPVSVAAAPSAPSAPAAPSAPLAPLAPDAPEAPTVSETIITIDPDQSADGEQKKTKKVVVYSKSSKDGDVETKMMNRTQNIRIINKGKRMSAEEREAVLAEVRESLAEADRELERVPLLIQEALVEIDTDMEGIGRTVVEMKCEDGPDNVTAAVKVEDGVRKVYLCQAKVMAHALSGLKDARKAISKNREIQREMREELLETLDKQIKEWEKAKT